MLATFIYPLTDHPKHNTERQALLEALEDTIRRPSFFAIQILLLHPASPAAQARAAERKDDDVLKRIQQSLDTLRDLVNRCKGEPPRNRVEIRLFWRTPPFSLFQTDNFASMSFYFRDRPISEVARYEFFTGSPVGVFVEKTFEDLWHDEQTIALEDYLQQVPVSNSVAEPAVAADRGGHDSVRE